jgi:two-component system, OmpR family, sensor histidine kinase AdeS
MLSPSRISTRIASGAVALSLAAAGMAAFVPDLVYTIRDALFWGSLSHPDQVRLETLITTAGQCAPSVRAFKLDHGFAAWEINYHVALGVLIAITAITGGWFAQRLGAAIGQPIEQLAQFARATGSGARDLPHPLRTGAADEVRSLHHELSRMTEALRTADADLKFRSSAIAHDLRTPLTIMRGRLIGLQSGLFQLDQQLITVLLRQVGIVEELVGDLDLLTSSRAMIVQPESIRIDELVRQVVDGHSDQLTHAGINVVIETVPVTALADSTKLSRAVANLLDNAIRYAPGSRLLVQVCPEPDDILLRLTDSGPGWPEQDPSALLDPFARGETSRSRDTGGAGLGLAIVQAIVTAHEGRISLSHAPDTGAIVEVRIPSA